MNYLNLKSYILSNVIKENPELNYEDPNDHALIDDMVDERIMWITMARQQ